LLSERIAKSPPPGQTLAVQFVFGSCTMPAAVKAPVAESTAKDCMLWLLFVWMLYTNKKEPFALITMCRDPPPVATGALTGVSPPWFDSIAKVKIWFGC
jgi:hypothetical protein